MNRITAALAGASLGLMVATVPVRADPVGVTIDRIETNQRISGQVTGLAAGTAGKYKVLVYAHTDEWYQHPYAGQGEGLSWAPIGANGGWSLPTVQRPFKADRMAALVVERAYAEPARVERLSEVPSIGRTERTLTDTPDFGKL